MRTLFKKNTVLNENQPDVIVHTRNPSTGRWNRDDQEFKGIPGYIASWKLAWTSKKESKEVARIGVLSCQASGPSPDGPWRARGLTRFIEQRGHLIFNQA